MKLRFTSVARDDLEGIWEYIAQENPRAATQVGLIRHRHATWLLALDSTN